MQNKTIHKIRSIIIKSKRFIFASEIVYLLHAEVIHQQAEVIYQEAEGMQVAERTGVAESADSCR